MVMENRLYERFNFELPLLYRSLDLKDFLTSKTVNVSMGGFSAEIDLHAHNGRLLQVKLLLPNEHNIMELMAKLVWARRIGQSKYQAGFEVLDLMVDYNKAMQNLFSESVL
jgi:hypothetical protein